LPHTYNTLGGRPGGHGGIPAKYEQRTIEQPMLYDLEKDVGEKTDVSAANPEIVQQLLALAEKARDELGDSLLNRKGKGTREPGRLAGTP
jgi:arylsulfatase